MSNASLALRTTWRSETVESHYQDVERVITEMRRNLSESFSLEQLAEIALMTPFHFNRVFRCVTGVPPCRFLWMLRLEEAKVLLLKTNRSVIDVCYDVGYNSLGTFTRRFTQLVGIPPLRFRRMATEFMVRQMAAVTRSVFEAVDDHYTLSAFVEFPDSVAVAVIGLFNSPVPYEAPVSCTTATSTGCIQLRRPPIGTYFLFAAGLKRSADPIDYLLSDRIFRGTAEDGGVDVGNSYDQVHRIELRPPQLTDPPLLPCLPALLQRSIFDPRPLRHAI